MINNNDLKLKGGQCHNICGFRFFMNLFPLSPWSSYFQNFKFFSLEILADFANIFLAVSTMSATNLSQRHWYRWRKWVAGAVDTSDKLVRRNHFSSVSRMPATDLSPLSAKGDNIVMASDKYSIFYNSTMKLFLIYIYTVVTKLWHLGLRMLKQFDENTH